MVKGQHVMPGLRMPLVRVFMDDLTTLTTTKARISVVKKKLADQHFYIKQAFPLVSEKPFKCLRQ